MAWERFLNSRSVPVASIRLRTKLRLNAAGWINCRFRMFECLPQHDRAHRPVALQRRRVNVDALSLHHSPRAGQQAQHREEHLAMRFHLGLAVLPRNRGVIRHCLVQPYPRNGRKASESALQVLSVTLFEKTPILRALQASDSESDLLDAGNQLILLDF
jgi:hypothetical protein